MDDEQSVLDNTETLILILQKRALRIVNNSTYHAHTSPIFKELKLLKFHDIHLFQLGFTLCLHYTPFQIQ